MPEGFTPPVGQPFCLVAEEDKRSVRSGMMGMRFMGDPQTRPFFHAGKGEETFIGVSLADKIFSVRAREVVGQEAQNTHRACMGGRDPFRKAVSLKVLVKRACDHAASARALEMKFLQRVIEPCAIRLNGNALTREARDEAVAIVKKLFMVVVDPVIAQRSDLAYITVIGIPCAIRINSQVVFFCLRFGEEIFPSFYYARNTGMREGDGRMTIVQQFFNRRVRNVRDASRHEASSFYNNRHQESKEQVELHLKDSIQRYRASTEICG